MSEIIAASDATKGIQQVVKGTIKSYFQRLEPASRAHGDLPPYKRICMDATGRAVEELVGSDRNLRGSSLTQKSTPNPDASSTTVPSSPGPRDARVFSEPTELDSDSDLSTPPSSPPACLPSPARAGHKAAFSLLKRKRSTEDAQPELPKEKQPLKDIAHNARKTPRQTRKPPLAQMQIDLGGNFRKTCIQCGMEYIPSNREDAALHSEFHDMNSTGIDVGKVLMKDVATRLIAPGKKRLREDQTILMVDRQSSTVSRNKIKMILEVVNSELSAPHIEDDDLWGGLEPKIRIIPTRRRNSEVVDSRGVRFKAFVYLVGDRCIGCCLMEKISSGYPVVKQLFDQREKEDVTFDARSSSISVSDRPDSVLLGVSRIWTSRSFRRQGIAETLLDCGRRHFFYGMEVTKDLVAFSQPTESGAQLAKRWYGAETGWHVFKSEN
ncbi:MAG: hypothetical protein Q9195_003770 [Heterodermia aff. obscurata]